MTAAGTKTKSTTTTTIQAEGAEGHSKRSRRLPFEGMEASNVRMGTYGPEMRHWRANPETGTLTMCNDILSWTTDETGRKVVTNSGFRESPKNQWPVLSYGEVIEVFRLSAIHGISIMQAVELAAPDTVTGRFKDAWRSSPRLDYADVEYAAMPARK